MSVSQLHTFQTATRTKSPLGSPGMQVPRNVAPHLLALEIRMKSCRVLLVVEILAAVLERPTPLAPLDTR